MSVMNLDSLKIKSKNSVDDTALLQNIKINHSLISDWVQPAHRHEEKALMVSAGRSTKHHEKKIKEAYANGYKVFCVKHSLPMLLEMGVVPTGVFMLDPRTIEGYSTHGEVRKDLYKDVPDGVIFFVASMTSPDVTEYLLSLGKRVKGWNASVTGLQEYLKENNIKGLIFNYGTSSATRAIGVIQMLGFRHLELVGYDGDLDVEPSEEEKRLRNVEGPLKYTSIVDPSDGGVFWSTGELLAQVQDMNTIVTVYQPLFYDYFDMWEGGLGWRAFVKAQKDREATLENANLGITLVSFYDQIAPIEADVPVAVQVGNKGFMVKDKKLAKDIINMLQVKTT